jgi:N-methylhydantoinase A/oxoprolinase/acetone carboxylase beta subunit
MTSNPSFYLGIDTGGTYTDGVLFDPQNQQVVKSVKVLTSHHDLRLCIENVLDLILAELKAHISLVSLSTTLATNAIAEGKRKPVALFLLGYDPELVHNFNFQDQFGTPDYFFITGRHDLNGIEQEPLDQEAVSKLSRQVKERVDAIAISSYCGPMNSEHEEAASVIATRTTGKPIVQAHHLSNELDSIRRATTASLNASLLSNAQDFLQAVEEMLHQKGIQSPVMIVRGDGSLVKADFARHRPVEIIHSGPATSTIGGQYLAGVKSALVIDIGGTTTDLALIDQGKIQVMEKAATVGPYRTCVRTIKTRSFGLGGDSLLRFDRWRRLSVGPERVIPLARLCAEYPALKSELSAWLFQKGGIFYSDVLEFWILRREPAQPLKDERARKVIEVLREGPQLMQKVLKKVGALSPIQVSAHDLVQQEIIERAGLTPTDLLHITGEFTPWDGEAAEIAARAAAKLWDESEADFARRIKEAMTAKILTEIISFTTEKQLSEPVFGLLNTSLDRWMFEENLSPRHPYLGCKINLKVPLIGIGAPAKAFLPPVAEALGTTFLLPEHYEVANAVGTVVGNVMVAQDGEVFPRMIGAAASGYYARVANLQQWFRKYEEAVAFTQETLTNQVAQEAREAGAHKAAIHCEVREILDGIASLHAWAIGKPDLNGSGR